MTQSQDPVVPYVRQVLEEQDAYRSSAPSVMPRAVRALVGPFGRLTNRMIPPDVIEAALRGADWAAAGTIRKVAIAHEVRDLAACDEAAADVRRWALGYGATGGGAAGAFGVLGLAVDVPATVTLALRTARMTALCYGFDTKTEAERLHTLGVLQLAGANSLAEREAAIARLACERKAMERKDWHGIVELTGYASGAAVAVQRVAATLGANLSARKLAQIAPVVGAAVGAGVNMAFQNDVAAAARFSARERWLLAHEGIVDDRGMAAGM